MTTTMTTAPARRLTALTVAPLVIALLALTACGSSPAASRQAGTTLHINTGPNQHRIVAATVASIAAEVPAAIRAQGALDIGVGAAGAGFPPLAFTATDDKTLIGSEPDLATLVAGVLGLKPRLDNTSWENLFVGLDSGNYDVGFSNITDTEQRKQKYDFATYRLDNLAFEAPKGTPWRVHGPADVAGRTIAVGSGTNQEKILVEWSNEDKARGLKPVNIKYYQNDQAIYLALGSGRIDAYFGPNPGAAYHVATAGQTQIIGTESGAGSTVQGKIAATTKKGDGLVKALADALDYVIAHGQYAQVLARWNLSSEAVKTSEINPPGLPLTDK